MTRLATGGGSLSLAPDVSSQSASIFPYRSDEFQNIGENDLGVSIVNQRRTALQTRKVEVTRKLNQQVGL